MIGGRTVSAIMCLFSWLSDEEDEEDEEVCAVMGSMQTSNGICATICEYDGAMLCDGG
jgi:hypothetical protein